MILEPLTLVKQLTALIEYAERFRYNYYEGDGPKAYYGCEALIKAALIEIDRLRKI